MKEFPSTIVIADDDEDDIFLLESSIKSLYPDTTITKVRNGLKLLLLLNSHIPNVIFLDINMPVKDGLECLQELRLNKKLIETRVVIYSTSNNQIEIDRCFELGANAYFVKPDTQEKLEQTIQSLFNDEGFLNNTFPAKEKFVLEGMV